MSELKHESWGESGAPSDTGDLLVAVAARLTRLYGQALARLDTSLTFRQHRLLMRVSEGHSSLVTLARFGNLTVPTVSASIDVLVRRELLTRTTNPHNRRAQVLALTPIGEQAFHEANVALNEINKVLLAGVKEDQRPVLHEALHEVFDNATDLFKEDPNSASE